VSLVGNTRLEGADRGLTESRWHGGSVEFHGGAECLQRHPTRCRPATAGVGEGLLQGSDRRHGRHVVILHALAEADEGSAQLFAFGIPTDNAMAFGELTIIE
jgi:hypothetical protein